MAKKLKEFKDAMGHYHTACLRENIEAQKYWLSQIDDNIDDLEEHIDGLTDPWRPIGEEFKSNALMFTRGIDSTDQTTGYGLTQFNDNGEMSTLFSNKQNYIPTHYMNFLLEE